MKYVWQPNDNHKLYNEEGPFRKERASEVAVTNPYPCKNNQVVLKPLGHSHPAAHQG